MLYSLHQVDYSRFKYILAAILNSSKEFSLRMSSIKFKIWLLAGVILFFIKPFISFILFGFILLYFIVDVIHEVYNYIKISNSQKKLYPKGLIIEFDDYSFQYSSHNGDKWNKVQWNDISIMFDNKMIGNITLFNRSTQQYHLFFCDNKNEQENFIKFREIITTKRVRIR